jgi:hypothetical protein
MTANNKPWKFRRTLVSCKNPSMRCKNPRGRNSTETLETLGTKNKKNSSIYNLRVVGGALKEVVHSYEKINPNIQVEGVETSKRRVVFAVATRR